MRESQDWHCSRSLRASHCPALPGRVLTSSLHYVTNGCGVIVFVMTGTVFMLGFRDAESGGLAFDDGPMSRYICPSWCVLQLVLTQEVPPTDGKSNSDQGIGFNRVCSRVALARVQAGAKREPGRAKHEEDETRAKATRLHTRLRHVP